MTNPSGKAQAHSVAAAIRMIIEWFIGGYDTGRQRIFLKKNLKR
jgi:hypothetical protein